MKLSAPKNVTWWISLALGVVGLLASFVSIPILSGLSFWLIVIGLALLLVATYLPNL